MEPRLEIDAVELRFHAERRLGEMIVAQKETVGLNNGGAGFTSGKIKVPLVDTRPTLAEAGIDKNLSSCAKAIRHAGEVAAKVSG